ncbi:DUF4136 domain-containing protein [Salinimicrobium sp. GXAS 041]|uniref:DUF4136 domain-containing protein n=1 Tax=Salinimicrobium sp. GXAS 041 TaxID=3400806 RepID=UPI003C7505F3
MKLKNYFFGVSFILTLFIVGCGPKVNTDKKTSRDLSNYSSYSFLPNQDTILNSNYDNDYINEIVIDGINQNMKEQNLRLERSQPDLLVYYHIMFDEEMAVNASPVYTNYSYYRPGYYVGPYYRNYLYNNYFTIPRIAGTGIEQVPYKEGTIVVDLIDRRTNEIVWRGRANDVVQAGNLDQEIRDYINAIFEEYPG